MRHAGRMRRLLTAAVVLAALAVAACGEGYIPVIDNRPRTDGGLLCLNFDAGFDGCP